MRNRLGTGTLNGRLKGILSNRIPGSGRSRNWIRLARVCDQVSMVKCTADKVLFGSQSRRDRRACRYKKIG